MFEKIDYIRNMLVLDKFEIDLEDSQIEFCIKIAQKKINILGKQLLEETKDSYVTDLSLIYVTRILGMSLISNMSGEIERGQILLEEATTREEMFWDNF